MASITSLLFRILAVEWREEHEDSLLHETLLCLKAMSTTAIGMEKLAEAEQTLFPRLAQMIFDEEKKGPSEFATRAIVFQLMFEYLAAATGVEAGAARARILLQYLRDPAPKDGEGPLRFIEVMHTPRPYRVWCKEVVNVTKEVFWIFLHNVNIVALPDSQAGASPALDDDGTEYHSRFFPAPHAPTPAAPHTGSVEHAATSYLTTHLDLLNGLIASLPTRAQRNGLRQELKDSGWERAMGGTMRLCKEKFYGNVHKGLREWVAAAGGVHDRDGIPQGDGWDVREVRYGKAPDQEGRTCKSPGKGKSGKAKREEAPRLEMPKLDIEKEMRAEDEGGWLL
jgi:hypothetical protein